MDFTLRSTELELMDNPNMDAEKYREAYLDINRCNKLLGGYGITINAVKKLIGSSDKKSYTILDMGCGDGEMLRRLAKTLNDKAISFKFIGVDLRDDVLQNARRKSKAYPSISYLRQDILELGTDFECDILLCTLTMHHFTEEQIQVFLDKFSKLAKLGVVINDLQRSKLAYALFKLFSIFFIKTYVAKYDGLVSISKGFLKNELEDLAMGLPTMNHEIKWKWAFRYVWVMKTKRHNTL